MIAEKTEQIEKTLDHLFQDSKYDMLKAMKGVAKGSFKPIQPANFKDVYLSISKEQGEDLVQLIKENNIQNIVEFGTSFGISTLFLAQGVLETKGRIVTTELIESKAKKAIDNFKKAGVNDLIEVKVGDAAKTLKDYNETIDLLFLDGWKDLYLTIFLMLESKFHQKTIIYVDNADMRETQFFLKTISQKSNYNLVSKYNGKVVLIAPIP